jgi:hypothetical protein
MSIEKNSLNSQNRYVHSESKSSDHLNQIDKSVNHFIKVYEARTDFFADAFIKKVKNRNRKALAELQRFSIPPTPMDLRLDFAHCIKSKISNEHPFMMKDGTRYTMAELKRLVPEWASIAEQALIESDPALADKLMTPLQWNAKAAFEVTFTSAMNELKDIKKTKQLASADHYLKWIIIPLKKAVEHAKEVKPPGNSLIGYGDRISFAGAIIIAETIPAEFDKLMNGK